MTTATCTKKKLFTLTMYANHPQNLNLDSATHRVVKHKNKQQSAHQWESQMKRKRPSKKKQQKKINDTHSQSLVTARIVVSVVFCVHNVHRHECGKCLLSPWWVTLGSPH